MLVLLDELLDLLFVVLAVPLEDFDGFVGFSFAVLLFVLDGLWLAVEVKTFLNEFDDLVVVDVFFFSTDDGAPPVNFVEKIPNFFVGHFVVFISDHVLFELELAISHFVEVVVVDSLGEGLGLVVDKMLPLVDPLHADGKPIIIFLHKLLFLLSH